MVGHILPVPSETGASDGDLEMEYITARYRIMLSAADYTAVVAKIRRSAGELAGLERRHLQLQRVRRHHRAFRRD